MEQKLRVLGVKGFKDMIEGKSFDSCKLRVEMPCPRNSQTEVGHNVVEMAYGKFDRFEELRRLQWPAECLLDIEPNSRGFEVLDLKRLPSDKVAK